MQKTEEVWKSFSLPLKRYIQKKVDAPHEVEDILQDVFVRIHSSIHGLRDDNKIRGWVYQITRNAIHDHYRNKKNLSELPESIIEDKTDGSEQFMERELSRCVYGMLEQMPDKYRQALLMTEMYGMTQKEMSEKLGISLSAAKSRVQRAKEHMKQTILDCCELELDRQGYIMDYRPRNERHQNNLTCCR